MEYYQQQPLYIVFMAGLILTAVISVPLIFYVWRRYSTQGALPLLGVLSSIFFWAFGYIIEFASSDLGVKLFSWNISYIGIVSIPVAILIFALQYTGNSKIITGRRIILLSIIPAITLLLQWTKNFHSLMYSDIYLGYDWPFLLAMKQYGPFFWVYWSYSFILLSASAVILVYSIFKPKRLSRGSTK